MTDPNELLDALRELTVVIHNASDISTPIENEFANTFDELDRWISNAGSRPRQWL